MPREERMPEIFSGIPIVIRIDGQCEDFDAKTELEIREGFGDVVVTRWFDDSLAISSRINPSLKEAIPEGTNHCVLSSQQMKVIRHIITSDFAKGDRLW